MGQIERIMATENSAGPETGLQETTVPPSRASVEKPGDMRVCELFAGVGGFRLALERSGWKVVWSNQWEPKQKQQWASRCYVVHFGPEGHTNQDIATVDERPIPDHELLVGGFPCQDYSVAVTKARGIEGKKGVLWWEIYRIIKHKKPPYLLLENVDRLLRSPAKQRGRDFAVMLWCLAEIGYAVEWRVLNAADYGASQKRRRVFIFGALAQTELGRAVASCDDHRAWVQRNGVFAKAFPVVSDSVRPINPEFPNSRLPEELQDVSDSYEFEFRNSGVMVGRGIWTVRNTPKSESAATLSSVLQKAVSNEYFVPEEDLDNWKYLKGPKAELRQAANGFQYIRSEGGIPFPDRIDLPSRTMVTQEGGVKPNRFSHLIQDPDTGRYRVLTPVECERLNQFPDGWTAMMPVRARYFCMGNALVVGLVERMGKELLLRATLSSEEQLAIPKVAR